MPLWPAASAFQNDSRWGRNQLRDALCHLAYRTNGARIVVRDVDVEFAFKGEDEVDAVERIDFQFFKSAVDGDGFGGNALRLGDHLNDARLQVFGHLYVTGRRRACGRFWIVTHMHMIIFTATVAVLVASSKIG
jgi:hypothetical protein